MSMDEQHDPITSDDLFVGLAIPQTLLGAPYFYTVASFMLGGILFLAVNNPFMLLVSVPLILLGRVLIRKDPYAIQTLWQYIRLRTRVARSAVTWSDGEKVISISPVDYRQRRPHARKA